jgi:hypothetical protein
MSDPNLDPKPDPRDSPDDPEDNEPDTISTPEGDGEDTEDQPLEPVAGGSGSSPAVGTNNI